MTELSALAQMGTGGMAFTAVLSPLKQRPWSGQSSGQSPGAPLPGRHSGISGVCLEILFRPARAWCQERPSQCLSHRASSLGETGGRIFRWGVSNLPSQGQPARHGAR